MSHTPGTSHYSRLLSPSTSTVAALGGVMGGVTQLLVLVTPGLLVPTSVSGRCPYPSSPPKLGHRVGRCEYPDVRHVLLCITVMIRAHEHRQGGDSLPCPWVLWHKGSKLWSGKELLLLAVREEHRLNLFAYFK